MAMLLGDLPNTGRHNYPINPYNSAAMSAARALDARLHELHGHTPIIGVASLLATRDARPYNGRHRA